MVEMYRAGSLVWVQRKHGTWWPGRIVAPSEIPPLFMETFQCSLYSSKLPIMLLGTSSNSLDWYSMESKPVKPFRCGEFDDCIEEAETCESSVRFNEGRKYVDSDTGKRAHREDAILHALALERKEHQKNLKREGDAQPETVCRGKRLKFTCVSVSSQSSTNKKMPALEKCLRCHGVKQTFVIEAEENTDIVQQKGMQTMLVNVEVSVEQISHGGHVPFICMISKVSQKPIIGHPVDIQVADDSSDNGITKPLFGRAPLKFPKLVWRTAKRTPVCYTSVATKSVPDSNAKGRCYPRTPESLLNNLSNASAIVNCVPVKHIFHRLLAGVR